eukprot:gene41057-50803_t
MGLGESAPDTLRMAGYYADIVVARHAQDGMVEQMARALDVPVVNAGEGLHHHPTQTLIDLFTMRKHFGTLDGLRVGISGGLRYSRAAKSLLAGLRAFRDVRVHVVDAVGDVDAARQECVPLTQIAGAGVQEHASVADMLGQIDVLYAVRVHTLLQLGQDVRGDDDGHTPGLQPAQRGVEVADGLGVQAVGGLVQQQHLGFAQQRLCKAQALAHALGVFAHGALARVGQAHLFEQRGALRQGCALEAGKKVQRLQPAQVVVQHYVFGQVAQVAARSAKVAALHRGAAHPDLARGGGPCSAP